MELEVEKKDDKSATVKVRGEPFGFLNMIREELWNDKNVLEAAILQDHPLTRSPSIFVKVKSGDPTDALDKAVDRIKGNIGKFRKAFEKAV